MSKDNTENIIENLEENNQDINTSNIFEDFENDLSLREELEKEDQLNKKDKIYYIKLVTSIFKYINVLLVLLLIIVGAYIYIQTNEEIKEKDYLNPFCFILAGKNGENLGNCSSIKFLLSDEKKKLDGNYIKYYNLLVPLLLADYNDKNFLKSKRVVFITEKTKEKVNPLEILNKFDEVKKKILLNEFMVQCKNIIISGDIINLSCSSYTFGNNDSIKMINGKSIRGSSISLASAFYKNIEEEGSFKVLDRQTEFSKNDFRNDNLTQFTMETKFDIKLKYINKEF